MPSLKTNYILNVSYQLLLIAIPLLTTPYLSRVLGAEGIGTYSYTYAIANYFVLLSVLGRSRYANRLVAKERDNTCKLNDAFSEIVIMQMLTGIVALIAYMLFIVSVSPMSRNAYALWLPLVASSILDITWLFFGLEEFKTTVTRNFIIKLGMLFFTFLLVRSVNDLWIYILINSVGTFLSQAYLWLMLKGKVRFHMPTLRAIRKHMIPNLTLFLPSVATVLYNGTDKVLLGLMSGTEQVGYYEYADKIASIPLALVTALGTVMLPRMTNTLARGNAAKFAEYLEDSVQCSLFLAFGLAAGIAAISPVFLPIFLGAGFTESILVSQILAFKIVPIAMTNVIGNQILLPSRKDKQYTISVFIGAFANIAANIMLIPMFQAAGAALGTCIAEVAVFIYQFVAVRKTVPMLKYVKCGIAFAFAAVIMTQGMRLAAYLTNGLASVITQFLVGCIVYATISIVYLAKTKSHIFHELIKKGRI